MEDRDLSRLKSVSGIGDSTLENFEIAGYHSLDDLSGISREELTSIKGIGDSTANDVLLLLDQEGLRVRDDRRGENLEKLQDLLRELLYLDGPDLDFGVYRIINQRRDRIETYVEEELPEAVEEGLDVFSDEQRGELEEEFNEVCEQIRTEIGAEYLDEDGTVTREFPEIPFAQELYDRHQQLQQQLAAGDSQDGLEAAVFNDLYKFFNRYYVDGDFNPQLRSSKQDKYAVPYNGEEVYFHWANKEQYFVKQTELLQDYKCEIEDCEIIFEVDNSHIERANSKGNSKYYLLASESPIEFEDRDRLVLRFEYRPLADSDYGDYDISSRGRSKQETIREAIIEKVRQTVDERFAEKLLDPDDEDSSSLSSHLKEFTTKNERDYFIHKDLEGFLDRERDRFLKNEVIDIDALESETFELSSRQRAKITSVNRIASDIIEFLAQIEDFQRKLYEKKKFVIDSDYLITLDHVPEELYSEILSNDQQVEAWRETYSIEEISNQGLGRFTDSGIDEEFLANHESMMVDTRFFGEELTSKILTAVGDIDAAVDGLLINGDNLHALDLLAEKYEGTVDCIYIDPPYNTGNDQFVYKDSYQHSSWLSMMADRLERAHSLLNESGAFFSSIDDNEVHRLNELLKNVFGPDNEAPPLVVRTNPRGRSMDKYIAQTHEYILSFVTDSSVDGAISEVEKTGDALDKYNHDDERGRYRRQGLRNRNPQFTRENRPNLFFPLYIDPEARTVATEADESHTVEVYPRDSEGNDDCWRWGEEKVREEGDLLEAHQTRNGDWRVSIKDYLRDEDGNMATTMRKSLWTDNTYNNQNGKQELKSLLGEHTVDFPKSVDLIKDVIEIGAPDDGTVLDFFAGSGTTGQAVLEMNARDDGDRQYILVEMGEYFDTVLKPRIQKFVYSDEWNDGKPEPEGEGTSQVVKYLTMESYDDSLNNIVLNETRQSTLSESREYLLQYLLENESEGSQSLLNVDELENPFSYELSVRQNGRKEIENVDLIDTFNYLIGLKVTAYEWYDEERAYLAVRGRIDEESAVVIWRDASELDVDNDTEMIDRIVEGESRIYVNGDAAHPEAQSLDQVFKNRMWDR